MTDPFLPYGRQSINESDIDAVTECLRGDWLTQGPRIAAFEAALCEVTGARHAVAVSNGTAALHLAALAAGLGPGDVGITSAITFLASANCIRYCGARVEFADVDPSTGLIDVDALEALVARLLAEGTPPRVIVPVDMCGQPCDLERISEIAHNIGALVIDDAAHALGGRRTRSDGSELPVGAGMDAAMTTLSFHSIKHITTGEGGAVLTHDADLARSLQSLRCHGLHRDPERLQRSPDSDPFAGPWYYEQDQLGFNYRITDLQCALGLSQLQRLDAFVARRQALATRYDARLAERCAQHLWPLRQLPDRVNAYHLYVVRLIPRPDEPPHLIAARRKALYHALRRRQIGVQVNYIPVPWHPEHGSHAPEEFPGALRYYAGCLSLPLFPAMHDDDVERVVDALVEVLDEI